jgi:hypothetical protein
MKHAKRRATERYPDLKLNVEHLNNRAKKGDYNCLLIREDKRRLILMVVEGNDVYAIYDKRRTQIVTFLTREQACPEQNLCPS